MANSIALRPGPGQHEALWVRVRRRRALKSVQRTRRYLPINPRRPLGDWGERDVTVRRYQRDERSDPIIVAVTGSYTVYCGAGWDHRVAIDQRDLVWPGDQGWDSAYRAWRRHDQGAAGELAAEMVERALEDWSDPCDDGDGMGGGR